MKINRVAPSKITNVYGKNKMSKSTNVNKTQKDTLQISDVGKSLSAYSSNIKGPSSKEKIERLRMEVSKGTYNKDSKLIAEKMFKIMKGKEV